MQIKKIKLNLLPSYIMFYDWLKCDDIKEYYNITAYRVNCETVQDFIKYRIKLVNKIAIINKPIIISDTFNSMAIVFDENGNSVYKSSLLLNDEIYINDEIINFKLSKFNYDKIFVQNNTNELRQITHIKNTILQELSIIENENDIPKLEFFYYELFNKKGISFKNMVGQIYDKLNNDITEKEIYLYDLIQKNYKVV